MLERLPPCGIEAEMVEAGDQLQRRAGGHSAAAGSSMPMSLDGSDGVAGFCDDRAVDRHRAALDSIAGTRAGRVKAARRREARRARRGLRSFGVGGPAWTFMLEKDRPEGKPGRQKAVGLWKPVGGARDMPSGGSSCAAFMSVGGHDGVVLDDDHDRLGVERENRRGCRPSWRRQWLSPPLRACDRSDPGPSPDQSAQSPDLAQTSAFIPPNSPCS